MNVYKKYCPSVYVALCEEEHEKGDIIEVTTKYGKENECVVFNFIGMFDDKYMYSIVRADGFDYKAYCEKKLKQTQEFTDVLRDLPDCPSPKSSKTFGEPVKADHYSSGKHRRMIEKNNRDENKRLERIKNTEELAGSEYYWRQKIARPNLSMPESICFFERELERLIDMGCTKRKINQLRKKLETARILWD